MLRALALVACTFPLALGATAASATVLQIAGVIRDTSILLNDSIDDSGGPIVDAIGGTVFGDFGQASASVGPAGDLGIAAQQRRTGNLRTVVGIRNDVIPNLTGQARQARANFIIDGGNLALVGGALSSLSFELELFAAIYGADGTQIDTAFWASYIDIVELGSLGGGRVTTFSGDDIGAAPSPTTLFQVDIPLSFQTFDIGMVPANGYVDLSYSAAVESFIIDFAEVVRWQFSDPLSVDGASQFPTVEFVGAATAVPAPPLAGLLGLAVVGLVAGARRRGA